jgi:16S rRNA (guanine(966)-N(2))-methyltransferase RsmD
MSKTARKHGVAGGGHHSNRAPHQVRIIGGLWKRTPLPVLDAEGLRPTPDRVRETVFNWITHLIDADWQGVRCLDLFAGTGALGFEAASRGAQRVVMVENHGPAARQLDASKEKLKAAQVEVRRGDALALLQGYKGSTSPAASTQANSSTGFNLIFADPPYHQDWLARIMPVCEQVLADGGLVYVESELSLEGDELPAWMAPWEVARADKAGMVFYHLLRRKNIG